MIDPIDLQASALGSALRGLALSMGLTPTDVGRILLGEAVNKGSAFRAGDAAFSGVAPPGFRKLLLLSRRLRAEIRFLPDGSVQVIPHG